MKLTIKTPRRKIMVFRNRADHPEEGEFVYRWRKECLPVRQKLYWIGPVFVLTQPKRKEA